MMERNTDVPFCDRHYRTKIAQMRRSGAWRDLGDLKREPLDLWTEECNRLAKEVMLDIETQRKPREKGKER